MQSIVNKMNENYLSKIENISWRKEKLLALKKNIIAHRQEYYEAFKLDYNKPQVEVELTELFPTLEEIDHTIAHLDSWVKPQSVNTPIFLLHGKSRIEYHPKGVVLIMSPWNYPLLLLMGPTIAAIAAGNMCVLRPSQKTKNVNSVTQKVLKNTFTEDEVYLFLGTTQEADELLNIKFDHIFFTGSEKIGKMIMSKAALHLTPVTLELGGKSPAIVTAKSNIDMAIDRLLWAKLINAGQTCVSPDYLCVEEAIYDIFVDRLIQKLKLIFIKQDFAQIIDVQNTERLKKVIEQTVAQGAVLASGGQVDVHTRYIDPTVIKNVEFHHEVMKEEIFGPLIPVVKYRDLKTLVKIIQSRPKPLALYMFTEDTKEESYVRNNVSSGGFIQNHCIIHLGNSNLPFGGVGQSGMGNYHGFFGFKTFSHERAVMKAGKFSMTQFLTRPYNRNLFQSVSLKFLKFWTRS